MAGKDVDTAMYKYADDGCPEWIGDLPDGCCLEVVNATLRVASQVARTGVGEKQVATGFLLIIGAEERLLQSGYVGSLGQYNKYGIPEPITMFDVLYSGEAQRYVYPDFTTDGAMIIDGQDARILGHAYKVTQNLENGSNNGGAKHKAGSAAAQAGPCFVVKCSEDMCRNDGLCVDETFGIFPGTKEAVKVLVRSAVASQGVGSLSPELMSRIHRIEQNLGLHVDIDVLTTCSSPAGSTSIGASKSSGDSCDTPSQVPVISTSVTELSTGSIPRHQSAAHKDSSNGPILIAIAADHIDADMMKSRAIMRLESSKKLIFECVGLFADLGDIVSETQPSIVHIEVNDKFGWVDPQSVHGATISVQDLADRVCKSIVCYTNLMRTQWHGCVLNGGSTLTSVARQICTDYGLEMIAWQKSASRHQRKHVLDSFYNGFNSDMSRSQDFHTGERGQHGVETLPEAELFRQAYSRVAAHLRSPDMFMVSDQGSVVLQTNAFGQQKTYYKVRITITRQVLSHDYINHLIHHIARKQLEQKYGCTLDWDAEAYLICDKEITMPPEVTPDELCTIEDQMQRLLPQGLVVSVSSRGSIYMRMSVNALHALQNIGLPMSLTTPIRWGLGEVDLLNVQPVQLVLRLQDVSHSDMGRVCTDIVSTLSLLEEELLHQSKDKENDLLSKSMGHEGTKAQTLQLLQGLTSTDKPTREQALKMYDQAKQFQAQNLVVGFVTVLSSAGSIEDTLRSSSAMFLRYLVSKDDPHSFCWPKVPSTAQQQVAAELLRSFETETSASVQKMVGDVISELAECVCESGDPRCWLVQGGANGWPQLLPTVFKMAHPSTSPNASACLEGLTLLKKLVCSFGSEMVAAQQEIGSLMQSGLGHAEIKIKFATLLLICEMVQRLKKKEWAPLMSTAPLLTQVLQQLAQANPIMEEELEEGIQELMEVAAIEPDFFKQQLVSSLQPATLFVSLVKRKEGLDESLRQVALEWLVSFAEKKPRWIGKSLQAYPKMLMECCMALMLDIEDSEAELKAWAERMDDEQGEEDIDVLFHSGEQSIDRVVQALGMDDISQALFALIAQLVEQGTWQATHAACAAIKQTVEYVENMDDVNEMARQLLQHVDNPHPRVRYTALHAIGQLANDQSPYFQEAWHNTVMPVLLTKMDDPVPRVAAMAISAFVPFCEELDNALMMSYTNPFMEKLVARLKTTSHRGVREESITAIAVIAGVLENDFALYYDATMPLLKEIVMHAKSEKESRLRGKSFECMSFLGLAAGKEKFLPDAQGAISEMLKTNLEADDVQREYINEASERICHCLRKDFAPFLKLLLPGILKSLKLEDQGPQGDDHETVEISNAEGKTVKVKSSHLEELMQSMQLLYTFADEMEAAFFDFVQPTAEALLPLINMQMAYVNDEAYAQALHTWTLLIKSAKLGAQERNIQSDVPIKLLQTFLVRITQDMDDPENGDPEALGAAASGIADCLKNIGEGCLSADEALKLVTKVFKLIDDSLQRTQNHIQDSTKQDEGAPAELQNDEDDEEAKEDFLGLEENCRRNYEEALGAVMKVAPQHFGSILSDCGAKVTTWLSNKRTRVLALYFACHILEHLKDASYPIWPAFMPVVFDALGDTDTDARTAAAYAINLASSIPQFSEAAPDAFKRLSVILSGPAPKKKDEKGKMAFENAVAAMLALAKNVGASCPPEVPAWTLVVSKLPILEDQEEAKNVHKIITDLVLEQNAGLLGDGGENLGAILSSLAEIYKQDHICETATDEKIKIIFKRISHDNLRSLARNFTEKQQKKIENMLS